MRKVSIGLQMASLLATGCLDSLHEYKECVDIETARCERRGQCDDDQEFQKKFSGFDENTCVSYVEEHCRTREIGGGGREWGAKDVSRCTAAIMKVECNKLDPRVDETEKLKECDFLEPAEETEPKDTDTDTEDSTDKSDG